MGEVLTAPFRFLLVYVAQPLSATLSDLPGSVLVLGSLTVLLAFSLVVVLGCAVFGRGKDSDPGEYS